MSPANRGDEHGCDRHSDGEAVQLGEPCAGATAEDPERRAVGDPLADVSGEQPTGIAAGIEAGGLQRRDHLEPAAVGLTDDVHRLAELELGECSTVQAEAGVCLVHVGELSGVRHDMALIEHEGRWAGVAVTATALMGPTGGVDRGSTVLPTIVNIGAAVGDWVSDKGRTDVPPGSY